MYLDKKKLADKFRKDILAVLFDSPRPITKILLGSVPNVGGEIIYASNDFKALFNVFLLNYSLVELGAMFKEVNKLDAKHVNLFAHSLFTKNNEMIVKTMQFFALNHSDYPSLSQAIIDFYKSCNISMNTENTYGQTALSLLLEKGSRKGIEFLVDNDAALFSLTPYQLASFELKYADLYEKAKENNQTANNLRL